MDLKKNKEKIIRIFLAIFVISLVAIMSVFFFINLKKDNGLLFLWTCGLDLFLLTFPIIIFPKKYIRFIMKFSNKYSKPQSTLLQKESECSEKSKIIKYYIAHLLSILIILLSLILVLNGVFLK